jgi:hypothetical protein
MYLEKKAISPHWLALNHLTRLVAGTILLYKVTVKATSQTNFILATFMKNVEAYQFWLKSDNNNGNFA